MFVSRTRAAGSQRITLRRATARVETGITDVRTLRVGVRQWVCILHVQRQSRQVFRSLEARAT